ncbi:MAG: glycosyltransferase [Gammaproteobacteria bacterium]|nr:glycosyltransferase [Gammaproteobacteria bacterium]
MQERAAMSAPSPTVTVLMSVYNGERYLSECIDSILNQSFTNFEFLIINDGSNDSTVKIINSYNDPRIRLVHNKKNIGLTKSLNKGIKLVRGKYIARMDGDDISLPHRLEIQLKCFDADHSLTLCAGRMRVVDQNGHITGITYPTVSDKLLCWHLLSWHLLFGNQIPHGSVMVKKEALIKIGGYAEWAYTTQDYELWSRMCLKYKMIVIPTTLIHWRQHRSGITQNYSEEQRQSALTICHYSLRRLTGLPINRDFSIHLRELVRCYNCSIKPYTIDALKQLNRVKLSFDDHYKPNLDTQAELAKEIKAAHRNLIKLVVRQLSFRGVMVYLYVLITYPIMAIRESIRLGCRMLDKALNCFK